MTVRLCFECHRKLHDRGDFDEDLKKISQAVWECVHHSGGFLDTRLAWLRRYGRDYL